MQAAPSNAAAHTLFARARDRFAAAVEPATRRRSAITLAKSALSSDGLAKIIASIGDDDDDADLCEPGAETAAAPAAC